MTASPETIAQALTQVEQGFAAFALGANSKRPVTLNGFKDATTDPHMVERQLSLPIAGNYGITWPVEREPVVVLDLDNGAEGAERPWQERLLELIDKIGELPPTKATTTPSGGRHAFYRWPADVPLPTGDELFGFTVRWPGRGYLVGPGSVIDGVAYLSGSTNEIAPLPPEWVSAAVSQHGKARKHGLFTVTGGRFEVPDKVTSGQRYATIRDYVASRYNSGLSIEELWELVRTQVAPHFSVPLDDSDLRDRFDRVVAKIEQRLGPPRFSQQAASIPAGALDDAALTDFSSQPIEWIWPGWLPRGVVTIMDGNPGVSKSTLVADLVARVTTGGSWPDETPIPRPGRVIWVTTEDDPGRVLRPRIEAAGGDASLVRFVTGEVVFPASAGAFLELLVRRASEPTGLVLAVLDPLFSHIEATVRTIADAEMRRGVMNPLNEAAEAANVAVLVVRHFNKDTSASAINRGAGSLGGIVGAARALWSVTADPEDDNDEAKVVGVSKLNYARAPMPLRYRVVDRVPPGWVTGSVSGIEWLGQATVSIGNIMSETADTRDAEPVLAELLKAGPVASHTIFAQMRARGYGRDATRTAKARLGVKATKQGMTGGWVWELAPEESEESEESDPVSSSDSSASRTRAGAGTARVPDPSDSSKSRKSPVDSSFTRAHAREGRCPVCQRTIALSSLGTIRPHYPDGVLTDAKWGAEPCLGSNEQPIDIGASA